MLQLGAHVSAAGGPPQALARGHEIGCDAIQIFTRNQRTWHAKPVTEEEAEAFRHNRNEHRIGAVMSHASYLINIASPDPENHAKSQAVLEQELTRCHQLGIELLNFHPGAHLKQGLEAGIERIAQTLNAICQAHPDKRDVTLVLENVAGQGTTVGADFAELAAIIAQLDEPDRFAVCIDTAHAFAAGYPLHTAEGWEAMWESFDEQIGLARLAAMHLNDSKPGCGSRKDRHALLGRGEIGPEAFIRAVTDPRTCSLPLLLETPAGPAGWAAELRWLRACAAGEHPELPQIDESGANL
ncbi:deoxyribonuclease IV [Halorhodospira abdelmalekii]|uniref:deoxyribonuclease IV n=1 Tax=Halorhodospira abdelmalekii TaxID=421629 RepID=UPI001906E6D8|nr:deoxyribonuclease IV [Halorhodospira abdelmalekii]MBK1735753.1 deoxyribonuclease IV [Halorhodospira abdelmalekii]